MKSNKTVSSLVIAAVSLFALAGIVQGFTANGKKVVSEGDPITLFKQYTGARTVTDQEKIKWTFANASSLRKITENAGAPLWMGGAWPSIPGTALSAAKLTTARTINGVAFDGTANITVADATKEVVGVAATADTAHLAAFVHGDIAHTNRAALNLVSGTNTGDQTTITGNAGTATILATARTINGVSFNGSANITVADATKEPAITAGTTAQYLRGDKSLATFAADALAAAPAETVTTIKTALGITTLSGSNTGDNAVNSLYSGLATNATHTGDATGSTALTVVKINGTSLAGLATGLLKNTTTTGVPSIAVAGTDYLTPTGSAAFLTSFPTLNQNTTGSAAKLTTARTINGVSFDGTANITVADGTKEVVGVAATADTAHLAAFTHGDIAHTNRAALNLVSGTNTGDQTTITGNAGTATALATGRTIAITGPITYTSPSFNGSGNVTAAATVTSQTGTGSKFVMDTSPTLVTPVLGDAAATSVTIGGGVSPSGTLFKTAASGLLIGGITGTTTDLNVLNGLAQTAFYIPTGTQNIVANGTITATSFVGNATGNAGTATILATARTINGVAFNGSANITVADATKEPAITAGTTAQYLRGDKSLSTFAADALAAAPAETVTTIKTALGITTLSGSNTGDNAVNSLYSGLVSNAAHTGDATGSTALTVVKINGTSLAGLATGLLKNTTTTGVPSIALAGTDYLTPSGSAASLTSFPTLNQNTTGSAAKLTTARTINGVSFDGTTNIQTATSGASDYAAGTWIPTIQGTTGGTATTAGGFTDGTYTRIGRMVFAHGRVVATSITGLTGNILIGGLPYVAAGFNGYASVQFTRVTNVTGHNPATVLGSHTQAGLSFVVVKDNAGTPIPVTALTASSDFDVTFVYQIS